LCAGFAVFFMKRQDLKKPDHFVQEKAGLNRLIQNSSEIHKLWLAGEESREWGLIKDACLKHLNISQTFDESLLRCNPLLLQCHALFSKNLTYRIVPFEEFDNSPYRYVTKANASFEGIQGSGIAVTIEDKQTKKRMDMFLSDQCLEVYLEERIYAYGEQVEVKDGEDYRFDNFGRHIYFDSHLVTNAEVKDWIKFGNPDLTRGIKSKSGNDLLLPATDLLQSQMENFCTYKGKQLMMAHVFDAATFLPMDLNEKTPKRNLRSPYYWTKKTNEYKPDCNLIYSKDCLAKSPYRLNSTSPTWAGMQDSMGGVFEVVRNPIDPESNLKASSFYFDSLSSWHKLGFRAGWNGRGFDLRDFDFRGLNPFVNVDTFQVGFRCMREVLQ
ncbi:MAG: hypothetical protein K2Q18_12875, partial [Bdellovibrionales bacterium]|nr:hypothetical protein [Bdellovibrionales bacterium]